MAHKITEIIVFYVQVVSITLAGDNQRAVAGGVDGRVYVFDMHSGCLVRTIATSHNAQVTGVKVTNNDDFLITAGVYCWKIICFPPKKQKF